MVLSELVVVVASTDDVRDVGVTVGVAVGFERLARAARLIRGLAALVDDEDDEEVVVLLTVNDDDDFVADLLLLVVADDDCAFGARTRFGRGGGGGMSGRTKGREEEEIGVLVVLVTGLEVATDATDTAVVAAATGGMSLLDTVVSAGAEKSSCCEGA